MKKIYVLDTNVLLSDTNCLNNFEDNDLVIPILVLEELDHHKGRSDEVGRNCREVSRTLDKLCETGSLKDGVKLQSGGTLKVLSAPRGYAEKLPPDLVAGSSVDNMILGFVLHLRSEEAYKDAILVSKDINVRVKCSSLGIPAEDYLSIRVSDNVDSLYTGVKTIYTTTSVVDDFYKGGVHMLSELSSEPTFSNQIVVLKSVDEEGNTVKSALGRKDSDGSLVHIAKYDSVFGLKCRNKEQMFSMDLLMNPNIKLVTLTGRAGCGKTLLALAAGLEQLESMGSTPTYQKLIVSRPVTPVGRDIGFLPGTLEEKMEPWISPIRDNLEYLIGSSNKKQARRKKSDDGSFGGFKDPYLELMQQKGLIEIEAISFIRGRSIPNAFMIIDEAQNLSMHELKTIITRVGDNTKIVLTGDIEQIDNVHVDTFTNGLTYAVEKFKEYDVAGHITLLKGERSELATLASKIL
jgi:PhoH-like ATPase